MDNLVVRRDNVPSVNVASTINKIKSIRVSDNSTFDNIIKYRFIAEYMRNQKFYSLLSEEQADKINDYLFKLRLNPDIVLCNDLGDLNVFTGGIFTGGDSETLAELEKLKKIVYEMVDYLPFNYREIFLNAYNYGNRY